MTLSWYICRATRFLTWLTEIVNKLEINIYISETEQLTLYIEYSLASIKIQAVITGG